MQLLSSLPQLLQCLELVPALTTPIHVVLHGITVKQLMVTATVVQIAMPWGTVVWMLTALHVKIIINYTVIMWLHLILMYRAKDLC